MAPSCPKARFFLRLRVKKNFPFFLLHPGKRRKQDDLGREGPEGNYVVQSTFDLGKSPVEKKKLSNKNVLPNLYFFLLF